MTEQRARPGLAARILIGAVWIYRRTLSPVLYFLGARCRHAPSCSEYAAEAVRRHGAGKGSVLAFSRLVRCHPLGSKGWDPVPETLPRAGWRLWRYGDWAWTERDGPEKTEAPRE
ncbi:MAG: membrane protein insertion efficiency factor YidD [Amphiplicatus sp.]